jgi:hypothetical protein
MADEVEKVKEKIKEAKEKKKFRTFSEEDFLDSKTAREYIEEQSVSFREAAFDNIHNIKSMLKSSMTTDEILDLDIKEYMSLLEAYTARMGISKPKIAFLEKK